MQFGDLNKIIDTHNYDQDKVYLILISYVHLNVDKKGEIPQYRYTGELFIGKYSPTVVSYLDITQTIVDNTQSVCDSIKNLCEGQKKKYEQDNWSVQHVSSQTPKGLAGLKVQYEYTYKPRS